MINEDEKQHIFLLSWIKMFNKIDAWEWGESEVNLDLTLCRQAWIFQATKLFPSGHNYVFHFACSQAFPLFFCLLILFFLDHEARFFVARARKRNNLYAGGQRQRQNS